MRAVAGDPRTEHLDIAARRLKTGRRRSDPDQTSTRLQHRIGPRLHLAANRVEHDLTILGSPGEILGVVVDDPVGPEALDVIVVAGAGGGDDMRADMLGELDRETGHPAGATLDQDCLAALQPCGVFRRPDRGQAGQRHRRRFGVIQIVRLPGDDRGGDLDLLRVTALDAGIHDPEYRVADFEVGNAEAERGDHAREVAAEDVGEFQIAGAAIGAAAEPHLVVRGIDAGGMDIDDDLARSSDRSRRISIDELLRPAMAGQQHRFHRIPLSPRLGCENVGARRRQPASEIDRTGFRARVCAAKRGVENMSDPEIQALWAKLAARPRSLDYRQRRKDLDARGLEYGVAPDVVVEPVSVGGLRAEWLSTPGANRNSAVLFLHGGGYVLAPVDSHRHLVAEAGRAAKSWALSLDSRLAPEHPFPAAVDDALAAYRFLLGRGIRPSRIALAGDSA